MIGAGTGGLSVASGAAQLGVKTVLFERGKMGGDCLNYGCVPSKALLAAAHTAQTVRKAAQFGVNTPAPEIDFGAVMAHVKNAIAAIEPHDSVERFERLGVKIIKAEARFTGPREVTGGGIVVRARRFVIAAGSSPVQPSIPGLADTPTLTNETLFSLETHPSHLLIIGAGPIGIEMAQAFRRLGSDVTVFDGRRLLSRDDPELSDMLRGRLCEEGVTIREEVEVASVAQSGDGIAVTLAGSGERIAGSHLLLAAGRKPRLDGLGLKEAGIECDRSGIKVDAHLRTTNPRVYAVGDITGGPQFTHIASYHAGIVIRNMLFHLPAKVDYRALPWVTYTDPELAQVGMKEEDARKRYGDDLHVVRASFGNNDRATAEGNAMGLIKIVTRKNGTILGASILGPHGGELIHVWALAISRNLNLKAFTNVIFPYPTLGEISKNAASTYYAPKLFSFWPRLLVRFLLRFG